MTRDQLLKALSSSDLHARLQAARLFAQRAEPGDAKALQQALAVEEVAWVKTALRQALARTQHGTEITAARLEVLADIVPPEVFDQIRTIAVNETTKRMVHEIEPIIGVLRIRARQEVPNFDASQTKVQIDRLHEFVGALDRLSRAAVAPTLVEFDLSALIRRVADGEKPERRVRIEFAGPTPLLVLGDATLVEIALANGLRNAIEAVDPFYQGKDETPPIVVTWGEGKDELWIAVLDKGPGPPASVEKAFDIGTTTKQEHLGMGLATARQAMRSLSGEVSLSLRSDAGGGRFELKWPRAKSSSE